MKTIPRRDGNDHPTQKPVMAMAWTMDALKVPSGATVFDPYMGSGTTGIACIRTGRRFIGVERDPTHYANAVERIRREIEGDLFHSQHNAKPIHGGKDA
jgi:DNA modification methylase